MKKTFKRADGTEETVEGTAEELANYERLLRGEQQTEQKESPGRRVLLDEYQRMIDEAVRRQEISRWMSKPLPDHKWWLAPLYTPDTDDCAIRRYFRENPGATSVMMVCYCRSCTVWCGTTDNATWALRTTTTSVGSGS